MSDILAQSDANSSSQVLYQNLRKTKSDTAKVSAFLALSDYYLSESLKIAHLKWIDSAKSYQSKAAKLSQKIAYSKGNGQALIGEAKIISRTDSEKAKKLALQGIEILKKTGTKTELGHAYRALMLASEIIHTPQESTEIAKKALILFRESSNKNMEAVALADLGYYMLYEGNYESALTEFKKSLKIKSAIGKNDVQSIYAQISLIYHEFGDTSEALEYGLKGVAIADKLKDESQDAITVYNNTAMAYDVLKNGKEAIKYYLKAYEIAKQYDNISTTTLLQNNLIATYFKSRRGQEALPILQDLENNFSKLSLTDQYPAISCLIHSYVILKQLPRAAKYIDKAIAESQKLPVEDPNQNYLYTAIEDYKFAAGEYDVAKVYLLKYKKMSEKQGSKKRLETVYKELFRIDSAQGNLKSAVANLKIYYKYRDSLYNDKKNKEIAELQVKFDTEKKDTDLLLLKKQGELQKTNLEQAHLTKNLSFGGILLLLVAVGLIYRRYRINQRIKKEIGLKNHALESLVAEKEWLLKEIHHRVKNNLQIVMSLLNTQSHFLEDKAAKAAIQNSQHRIHSMSLIHKKLYQSENVIAIDMPLYIQELVEYFKLSFDTGQRIRFVTDIEPIKLDNTRAVPLGLILNEAIINAIKHAFPDKKEGIIWISLQFDNPNEILLTIKDNGIGIPDFTSDKDFPSLGMKLIKGFSGELNGKLHFETHDGLTIRLRFAYDPKRIAINTKNAEQKSAVYENN